MTTRDDARWTTTRTVTRTTVRDDEGEYAHDNSGPATTGQRHRCVVFEMFFVFLFYYYYVMAQQVRVVQPYRDGRFHFTLFCVVLSF